MHTSAEGVKGEALLQLRQFLDNVKVNALDLGSSAKKNAALI